MEIQGDTSSCSGCGNAVKVYYYPNDGPIASGAQLITSNYNLIGSPSFGVTTTKKTLTFSLGGQYDRFYIAVVEENSCFTLRKLNVLYKVCPTEKVGLVVYPNTPIGSSAVTTSASCKANAAVSPGSSLSITCNTDGTFSGSPSCYCKGGHFQLGETCYGEIIHYQFASYKPYACANVYMYIKSNYTLKILLPCGDASTKMTNHL